MPNYDFRAYFMPYCLERRGDDGYAVLNRAYRPLGYWERQGEGGPPPAPFRISPKMAATLSHKRSPFVDRIYLYDDDCVPTSSAHAMRDYLTRLERLMMLKLESMPDSKTP